MTEIKLGKFLAVPPISDDQRFTLLLWGPSGCGKTTLAATAPGEKLVIMFDPDGERSLAHRTDCHIIPLYKENANVVEMFKSPNPLDIERTLRDNPQIKTVLFDSTTTFGERSLAHGVVTASGTVKGKSSTLEDPGRTGYGYKNTWMHLAVSNLLASTARYGVNMIFLAHEGAPDKDEKGNTTEIGMLLGSSLSKEVPIKISEVWCMYDTGTKRRLAIRPTRMRTPMKTRMFDTSGEPEFDLKYDPYKDQDVIAEWYNAWKANGFKKIPLPK